MQNADKIKTKQIIFQLTVNPENQTRKNFMTLFIKGWQLT